MENQKPVELNDNNFRSQVLEADVPVLVDFWAPWCAPCRAMAPTIDALATSHHDSATIGKVNIDDNPELAKVYGISSIPTVLVFQKGEVVERLVGGRPRPVYEGALKRAAASRAA